MPLVYGHVDPTTFPVEHLVEAARAALTERHQAALNYGPAMGNQSLRAFLRSKLARDEGLELEPAELMITAGASAALDAAVRLYTRPGDTVLVEAPSYHEALEIIRDYPVRLSAVPLDDLGLRVEVLAEQLARLLRAGERPVLLYTIPSFQNPTGATLDASRRPGVLELARQYDLLVIEDDVYRDLYFEQPPPASLYALDEEPRRTIRLGSFSKILAPGLRLGWAMGSAGHIQRLLDAGLTHSGGGASPFSAAVTAAFCERGWLEPHIARLRGVYRERRDAALQALEHHMPTGVQWNRPGGGFFIWLTLPEPLSAGAVLREAEQRGITFATGEAFYAGDPTIGGRQIRLPFSFVPCPDLVDGISILADAIRRVL